MIDEVEGHHLFERGEVLLRLRLDNRRTRAFVLLPPTSQELLILPASVSLPVDTMSMMPLEGVQRIDQKTYSP